MDAMQFVTEAGSLSRPIAIRTIESFMDAMFALRLAAGNVEARRELSLSRQRRLRLAGQRRRRLAENAERRAAAVSAVGNRDSKRGEAALRRFVEWVVAARKKLEAWDRQADGTDPPVSDVDFGHQQREAVKGGADPKAVEAIELREPNSLIAIDAERRLFENILRKGEPRGVGLALSVPAGAVASRPRELERVARGLAAIIDATYRAKVTMPRTEIAANAVKRRAADDLFRAKAQSARGG